MELYSRHIKVVMSVCRANGSSWLHGVAIFVLLNRYTIHRDFFQLYASLIKYNKLSDSFNV